MLNPTMCAEDYHAHPFIGSTTAKLALKSRQLLRDAMTGVYTVKDKPCFQVGRLAHMMVLEPDRFSRCTTDKGPVNPKTGEPYGRDTKAFASWQADNPEVTVVEPWLYLMLERMPAQVCELLSGGVTEQSVFVDMPLLGFGVKCRPDHLLGTVISDIKTISNVDDAERDLYRRGYWFSHGWYRMVMRAETGRPHSMRFIYAETNPPYRWRIVDLAADYIMRADDEVERVLSMIGTAKMSGDWSDQGELEIMAAMPDRMSDDEDLEDAA